MGPIQPRRDSRLPTLLRSFHSRVDFAKPCMAATSPRGKSWRVMRQQFGLVPHCRVCPRIFSTILWNRHRSAGICSNERYGTQPSHRTSTPVLTGHPRATTAASARHEPHGVHRTPSESTRLSGATRRDNGSLADPPDATASKTERKMPDLPGNLGFREWSRLIQLARQALPANSSFRTLSGAKVVDTFAVGPHKA